MKAEMILTNCLVLSKGEGFNSPWSTGVKQPLSCKLGLFRVFCLMRYFEKTLFITSITRYFLITTPICLTDWYFGWLYFKIIASEIGAHNVVVNLCRPECCMKLIPWCHTPVHCGIDNRQHGTSQVHCNPHTSNFKSSGWGGARMTIKTFLKRGDCPLSHMWLKFHRIGML